MAKETLKSKRENPLYTKALQLQGNGKLLDYDDPETGEKFRYAQVNVPAVKCCPFATEGCKAVCYATKGNHVFPSVQKSRERSLQETKRTDFAEAMFYTITTELSSKRYADCIMLVRTHESGDFYSLQYLKKTVKYWSMFEGNMQVRFVFYTKSFPFFLQLTEEEQAVIIRMMEAGQIAMNLSLDDTTTEEQWKAYAKMRKVFRLANTYICTIYYDDIKHDNVCDCANCAKCGTCNRSTGKITVVIIHSASKEDIEAYRRGMKRRLFQLVA